MGDASVYLGLSYGSFCGSFFAVDRFLSVVNGLLGSNNS